MHYLKFRPLGFMIIAVLASFLFLSEMSKWFDELRENENPMPFQMALPQKPAADVFPPEQIPAAMPEAPEQNSSLPDHVLLKQSENNGPEQTSLFLERLKTKEEFKDEEVA